MVRHKRKGAQGSAFVAAGEQNAMRQGIVGLGRTVPSEIERPPYANSGDPGLPVSPLVRTDAELEAMRVAGTIAAEVLIHAGSFVAPGITTDKIDEIVHAEATRRGAYPSPLNYRGFPKSVCTSVNEVICHGIPDDRKLRDGDIINIDVTVYIGGVHGDTSCTFAVGEIDEPSKTLIDQTYEAMNLGIKAVRRGARVRDIGRAIERHSLKHGLGVIREFIGHGVGTEFHSNLGIPHYYDRGANTVFETGMTFTIEPMLTLGDPSLYLWDDGWTALTRDRGRSAQFEHTLVVTDHACELLTVASDGSTAAEIYAPIDRSRVG